MSFVDKATLLGYLKEDNLVAITSGDDTVLDVPISDAESLIRDYLSHRYNVDVIYADPANVKYRTLRKIAIDLAIYNLYCGKVNPRHVPEMRMIAYDNSKKDLERISKGMIGNDFPEVDRSDDTKAYGEAATHYDPLKSTEY